MVDLVVDINEDAQRTLVDMDLNKKLCEETLRLIATEYQIPVDMLTGARTTTMTINERDVRRFYARHNAMLKGIRRRLRRSKALIQKLTRR